LKEGPSKKISKVRMARYERVRGGRVHRNGECNRVGTRDPGLGLGAFLFFAHQSFDFGHSATPCIAASVSWMAPLLANETQIKQRLTGNQAPADWEREAGYLGKWWTRSPSN
jgi:hypothetical protein